MAPIRVLTADDSLTMRAALMGLLRQDEGIEVVGSAKNGDEAVALAAALSPDVLTMDVMMPGLDGLEATRAIMKSKPCRILVVSAISENAQVDLSFRALDAGALDLLQKPEVTGHDALQRWGLLLRQKIHALSLLPLDAGKSWKASAIAGQREQALKPVRYFALVASTGGPPLLADLLNSLAKPAYSVLIAQHIASGFTDGLQRWLKSRSSLEVAVASPGETPRPGWVYLAPDGRDIILGQGGRFETPLSPGGVCPSGDRLLLSLAKHGAGSTAAAVLTGMGADGATGLIAVKESGGLTLAQDEATSVVYGMPKEAYERGGASRRVSPSELITLMRALAVRA
jgi:two-component system chemotaxis response regulator CheB